MCTTTIARRSVAQDVPRHVGAQLFARHGAARGGFDVGAALSGDAPFVVPSPYGSPTYAAQKPAKPGESTWDRHRRAFDW